MSSDKQFTTLGPAIIGSHRSDPVPPSQPRSEVGPRLVIQPEAIKYHLLRPREAGPADLALFREAYGCWSEVWRGVSLLNRGLADVGLFPVRFVPYLW